MKLPFKIAKRFLLSSKGQSILIITGISIGISLQLFIALLIEGLQSDLINATVGDSSQITITDGDDYIDIEEAFIQDINEITGVETVTTVLRKDVFMGIGNDDYGMLINGVDYENDIYGLNDKLIEGKLPLDNNEIIISNYFDVKVGDAVTITSADKDVMEFKIVGIFDYKNAFNNEKYVYTNLNTLQKYLGLDNLASAVEIQVEDVFDTEIIADNIETNFDVITWQEENSSLLSALSSQSASSAIIQVSVVISVALAITSVLIISVVQKSKQIGILKAMGLSNNGISLVFIFQGLMLGVIGSIFGIILAIILLTMFSTFAVDDLGDPVISIYFSPYFILLSFVIGTLSATIASMIPAYKSKKLSAMEVINNG